MRRFLITALLMIATLAGPAAWADDHWEKKREKWERKHEKWLRKHGYSGYSDPYYNSYGDRGYRDYGYGDRFRPDRYRDGAITRYEWRGSDRSFVDRDRNHDGVISGRELRDH